MLPPPYEHCIVMPISKIHGVLFGVVLTCKQKCRICLYNELIAKQKFMYGVPGYHDQV